MYVLYLFVHFIHSNILYEYINQKYMNSYTYIFITAFILLFISIYNEDSNIEYLDKCHFYTNTIQPYDYIFIYILRYFHYLTYLFCCFYLLFFLGIGTEIDRYIYFAIMFFVLWTWYVFENCILSFCELTLYGKPIGNIEKSFHTAFHPLYGEYAEQVFAATGLLNIFTMSILLYYSTSIYRFIKIGLFVAFITSYLYVGRSSRGTYREPIFS